METTTVQKENLRTIIEKVIANDQEWLNKQEILWGDKNTYWILNYRQGSRNAYNSLVRGLVIAKPPKGFNGNPLTLIKSFPFIRFFNHGENDAAHVDFSNAEMLEKMDGTMVGVFFPHNAIKPEFHTRKMMSTHQEDINRQLTTFDGKNVKFLPTIRPYVDQLNFATKDINYTFVFEFIHEISYVLTKYKPQQYGLYLLGARNLLTHREMNEDELDETAHRINAKRPRRFDAIADFAEIDRMFAIMAAETPDFEGYIFLDKKTGNRVKVKDPKYVEKHHLLDSLSYKRLIPLVLKGEEDEIIAYFPHAKARIQELKNTYNAYLEGVIEAVKYWQGSGFVGKELALRIFGPENSAMDKFTKNMSKKYNGGTNMEEIRNGIDIELKKIALGTGKEGNGGSPKRLIELIGLNDDEEITSEDINE